MSYFPYSSTATTLSTPATITPETLALEADLERLLTTIEHAITIHGPYSFVWPEFSRVQSHPASLHYSAKDLRDTHPISWAAADAAVLTRQTSAVSGSGCAELDAFEALRAVVRALLWPILQRRDEGGLTQEVWGWAVWGASSAWVGDESDWIETRRAELHRLLKSRELRNPSKEDLKAPKKIHVMGTILTERMMGAEGSLRTWQLLRVLCSLLGRLGRPVVVGEVDWVEVAAGVEIGGEDGEELGEEGGVWSPLGGVKTGAEEEKIEEV